MSQKYKLYANCIPIKGAERSIIQDLQRGNYSLIPNSLFDILNNINSYNISILNELNNPIINEYIDFLIKEEYLFTTDEPECFPSIGLTWDSPLTICNSIIDFNNDFTYFNSIINQLDTLCCNAIQLRIFKSVSIEDLSQLMIILKDANIASVDIIIEYSKSFNIKNIRAILSENIKVKSILFYNAPYNKCFFRIPSIKYIPIYFSKECISENSCGVIHPNYFAINIRVFTESIHFNTCLNRKICIDANGCIKNCPSMQKSFGNIKNTTLEEAINKPDFKDLWGIKKDDIDVCKDCEFRYMCTDCRCFTKDSSDIYSQPAKCSYNPYIALWKGQEGWISVEQWRTENPNWEKDVVRLIPGKDYYKNSLLSDKNI